MGIKTTNLLKSEELSSDNLLTCTGNTLVSDMNFVSLPNYQLCVIWSENIINYFVDV